MSRYEWESGEIKIPAAEWRKFKETLQNAFHENLSQRFDLAKALYAHLKEAGAGKRNFDFRSSAESWAEGARSNRYGRRFDNPEREVIPAVLSATDARRPKPRVPKKKAFQTKRNVLLFYHPFMAWEASLVLDQKTRTVRWSVPENNHAVDCAWQHPMGRALERALNAVKWTRGSGGALIGNDEYNRDSTYEGGGGNYVTRRFGPLGRR